MRGTVVKEERVDNQEAAVEEIEEEMEPREERVFRLLRKQKCVVEAAEAAEAAEATVAAEMEAQTIIMESQAKNPVPEEVVVEHLIVPLAGKHMAERDTMAV